MAIFETKIADVLRSVAASLQLSMLIPSIFLVGSLIWLLAPPASIGDEFFIISLLVIAISYLFNAFNLTIIRVFEGYIKAESAPLRVLRDFQLQDFYGHCHRICQYSKKVVEIQQLENDLKHKGKLSTHGIDQLRQWRRGWEDRIVREQERLEERYPFVPERVLATSLGNAIASFELYPERRYWIDMAALWPRFVPTLLEKKYAAFIESEKALLDFFLNLLVTCSFIWPISVIVFARTGNPIAGLMFFLVPCGACLIYKGSCIAAANWGATVKSAFDLYRFELKDALKLQLPERATLSDERSMWRGISEFLAFGMHKNSGELFNYTSLYKADKSS